MFLDHTVLEAVAVTETLIDRIVRLGGEKDEFNAAVLETIAAANLTDDTLKILVDARVVGFGETCVLPRHRLENLSRGKGWARKGKGDKATWGERVGGGYRVGPGAWTVGGHDGFTRKGEDRWTVEHVTVGAETWTVAT